MGDFWGDLWDPEVIVGLVALTATVVLWLLDRRRKRIGWRVQMDAVLRDPPDGPPGFPDLTVYRDGSEVADASFALVRVENDGSKPITREDIQELLTVDFDGRQVVAVIVTDAQPRLLIRRLERLTHQGSRITLPPFALNPGNHFKLLVLLSGEGSGGEVETEGLISGGRIVRNKQRTGPRPLYLVLVALLLVVTSAITLRVVNNPDARDPACATGTLTLIGSTAFEATTTKLAEAYMELCPDAVIEVDPAGSEQGLFELAALGQEQGAQAAADHLTVADGRADEKYRQFDEHPLALNIFAVVVNRDAGIDRLTLDEIHRIYRGEITNWSELDGNDRDIALVSRDTGSGTRALFERLVLGFGEPLAVNSGDCRTRSPGHGDDGPLRCERRSTGDLLTEVNRVPGAIGYAEAQAATDFSGVRTVAIDDFAPNFANVEDGFYPFWEVQYLYSYRTPEAGSPARKFLDFLSRPTAQGLLDSPTTMPCDVAGSDYGISCDDPHG
ncbi:substrate-binding domain-containing protein [Streptomyces aidingensis]|uniref:ABC-type phosphate transport system, substrate-binding protein n=1 Tax=Streptomyces aidingensis TaxID=910347 RepID=A0A1I1EYK8_9ACTN|nr:substrate-binding domain-containing protein [Streptomyces aidingensis]SFB90020.1 ABC-type phosphate transport system, substrate-binding protein [Streptomyces aidingensis]